MQSVFPNSENEDDSALLDCSHLVATDNPGEDFLTGEDWARIAAHIRLTNRELCVAVLIFEGKTRYQIARSIGCAAGTVRVYIDRLFAKLNVRDRVGLVLRVVRIHLSLSNLS